MYRFSLLLGNSEGKLFWNRTLSHIRRPGYAAVLVDGKGYLEEEHVVVQLWDAAAEKVVADHKELVYLVVLAEHLYNTKS